MRCKGARTSHKFWLTEAFEIHPHRQMLPLWLHWERHHAWGRRRAVRFTELLSNKLRHSLLSLT